MCLAKTCADAFSDDHELQGYLRDLIYEAALKLLKVQIALQVDTSARLSKKGLHLCRCEAFPIIEVLHVKSPVEQANHVARPALQVLVPFFPITVFGSDSTGTQQ